MNLSEFTLVPREYRKKDPRTLLYYYPTSINVVAYAKKMQKFSFYQTLEVAEELAKKQGFILLPYSCMHWQRAKNYGVDRKIKIGRNSYFLMKPNELTKTEIAKLKKYLEEVHEGEEK